MKEARIQPLSEPYAPEIAEALKAMMPPGIPPIHLFRTFAKNPRIMQKIMGGNLLDKGSLSLRQREIVIDRVCALCGSEYEWGVHVAFFAQKVGLNKEQIQSLTFGNTNDPVWEESEKALIQMSDELHQSQKISDALWQEIRKHYSEEQVMELLALNGFYRTISYFTNALQIELEAFAPKFNDYQPVAQ